MTGPYPKRMTGLHLNMMPVGHNAEGLSARTPEESRYLEELRTWGKEGCGYFWIQGTRPQTLAFCSDGLPGGSCCLDRREIPCVV
jgi:microsomal epoxide hydrolase